VSIRATLASLVTLGTAASFVCLIVGCGGEDVEIESKNGIAQSALKCQVAPGEDVCAKSWDFPDRDHADVVTFLASTASYAGIAHDALERLNTACVRMMSDLGAARSMGPANASLRVRAESECAALAPTIMRWHGAFTFTIAPNRCTEQPRPTCARAGSRKTCEPAVVTVVFTSEATEADRIVGASLQRNLATVVDVKTQLDAASDLVSELALVPKVSTTKSTSCLSTASAVVTSAKLDANIALHLASSIEDAAR
jgi:hypothetical protein